MARSTGWHQGGAKEVLFLDSGVDDAEILIAGLRPDVQTEPLPAKANPIDSIGFALAGRRDIEAVHILSHGASGKLLLCGGEVDTASFAARPDMLARIRSALADDAEIILYGCSVAEGPAGASFVARLSEMLGCRVVASATPTGAASLGGDWDLPTSRDLAFAEDARAAYPGLLIVGTFGIVTTINTTTTLTSNEGGVTIDVTKSDGVAMAGVSSGFLDPGVIPNTTSYTLTFGTAVNVTQFQIGEFTNNDGLGNYTFTPNTGSAVILADNSGSIVGAIATLTPGDWTGITSFTVSYTGGANWRVGLDNIRFELAGPAAPGTPDLIAASDTGTSSTDNITNNATPTVSGTGATAGNAVHVLVGGVTVGTTTADGSGNWTFAFSTTLSAGTNAITAIQDSGTAESTASTALNIVVDTTGPTLAAPDLLAASDSGSSNTDNITNASTQQIGGSATTGDVVSVLVGGVTAGIATAAGGSWSYSLSLTAGSYAVTVSATDTAGNAGAASSALGLTVDTTAPTTLAAPDLLAASDLGSSSTDNITSATTQQVGGSATNGDVVSVLVGGATVGVATASGGSWTYALSLAAGSYAVTAGVTDAAGNAGPASAALGIVIDTTAPGTAGTPDLLASSDSGSSSTDDLTNNATPTVTGTGAVANSLVHVLVGGATVGTATASGNGAWTYTLTTTLAAGTNQITARAEDVAGNDGPASTALTVVIDTTAPAAPGTLATPDLIASSDDGASSTDNVTTVSTPTFNGTNTTGSAVHALLANGVTVGTFTSEAAGTYNVTASSLSAGSYAITIRELDSAGNVSSDSPALGLTISAPAGNGGGGGGGGGGDTGSTTPTVTTPTVPTTTTTTNTSAGTTTETKTLQNTSTTTSASAAIVENTNNNGNVVTATLPGGTSLSSEGPATAQTATQALTTLISAVDARNSAGEAGLITGAQSFLTRLASTTTLDVRTIIPTTTSTSLSTPIVITGTAATTGATQSEAFVIDVRSLPSGSTLQLDNIEFASIIGSATVNGGGGDNFATGDDSAQFISLGVGDDTLLGGDGADTIGSGTGNDSLDGEGGDDRVFGGEGNDTVIGSAGFDVVYGNQQSDLLYGNQANDTLYGGQDSDTVFGGQADDLIYGNMAADSLSGQLGADTIFGGQGDDLMFGGNGNDLLLGNRDNDLLSGGQGDDTLSGGADQDVLYGGFGDDNLNGGAGDDTLYGGVAGGAVGIDVLDGGAGNDALYGGEGVDWIYTGEGSDAIYIEALNGFDVIVDFDAAAGDVIHIASDANGSGLTGFAQVQAAATDNADGHVEIALGSNNYVRVIGVGLSDLTSDMFQFF